MLRLSSWAALLLLPVCTTPGTARDLPAKKLIEYGWDVPDTAFVRERVREMEKIPFDGVVIKVQTEPKGEVGPRVLGWEVFSKNRFQPEDYEHAIADLNATKFKRFTDNFIQVIAYPGDVDWFDPEWPSIAHNAACLAKVAKLGGCAGIMFDPEHYGKHIIFSYKHLPDDKKAAHTYDQYFAKVKERGKEFIRAINKEFPDVAILCLYGSCMPYLQSRGTALVNTDYSLLLAFYDGICQAATPGTTLVDGHEWSYGYRTLNEFKEGRKTVLERSKTISTSPKAFERHVRAGFGVWADWNSGSLGWHPEDFSQNYFSPNGLRASLNYALESADKYVWVYSERLRWWDFNVPDPYVKALADAKKGPGPGEKNPFQPKLKPVKAAELPHYSDEETFARLRKTMTEVFDFPKDGWRFARDESNTGRSSGWYKPGFDDSGWRTISIGKFWEEQGEDYDGRAWYRIKFVPPAIDPAKRVFLAVGAADESAWVWLNGRFIAEHNMGGFGWDVPFALEVTNALDPEADNVLAIQVLDRTMVGGLWKSIKLMVK